MNIYHHLRLLIFSSLCCFFLFTACRNEPQLDNLPKENIVKVRLSGDPENLNFILTADASAGEIFKLLSVPLASFDPSTYKLTPTLIKKLPKIEEITTGPYKGLIAFEFEILDEATWDNGTPITANDMLFTLKAVRNPNYGSPHLTRYIKYFEMDADNPKKFRVYGDKYILAKPVISNFEVMPKYVYDPDGLLDKFTLAELSDAENTEKLAADTTLKAFAKQFQSPFHLNNPEGISYAGPYKVESWTTGQEIVLKKKDNWWGDKLVKLYPLLQASPDKIIYKFVPDINAAISLAKNGELDVIKYIPWSKFMDLKEDDLIQEQFNFYTPEMIAYRYIGLNHNRKIFEDKKVRHALDHLFNRDQIYNTVYYGASKPIIGPVHPSKPYYNKNLTIRSFDIDKAKNLLSEAGWKDSDANGILDKMIDGEKVEMKFDIIYSSGFQDYANILAIFKEDAIKAGVQINPVTAETQAFRKTVGSRDFDAFVYASGWYPLPPDLSFRFQTKGRQNYGSFSNAELDGLISKINTTIDDQLLPDLYLQAQEIIHEEMPSIFINNGNDRIIISKKFDNIRVTSVKPNYYLNEFMIKTKVPLSAN
jgi:peptide/nickel transport system substrate-binding protein